MTSKEALERIYNDAISLNEIEEDVEKIEEDYNIIKQDLERLKKLEKENEYLKNANEEYQQGNYELSMIYAKQKQALDILKVIDVDINMILKTDSVYSYNEDLRADLRLSKEEYELLKEVLGYD